MIAAIGIGVHVCYPKENKKLSRGFWSGERSSANCRPGRTPLRKISRYATEMIAGMPLGVVIVEGM
jgi:hypothetical protein